MEREEALKRSTKILERIGDEDRKVVCELFRYEARLCNLINQHRESIKDEELKELCKMIEDRRKRREPPDETVLRERVLCDRFKRGGQPSWNGNLKEILTELCRFVAQYYEIQEERGILMGKKRRGEWKECIEFIDEHFKNLQK